MSQITPTTWYETNYINGTNPHEALSDLFYDVFRCLGSEIIVFDPYFIGDIVEDENTKALSAKSESQIAFLNAVSRHLFETNFSAKFIICGCRERAKSQARKCTNSKLTIIENMYRKYQKYLNGIVSGHDLYPENVDFFETKESFHNRYYFSRIIEQKSVLLSKPIVVTNSIGNIREVDIIPVENELQIRTICSKYVSMLSSAKSINEVLSG